MKYVEGVDVDKYVEYTEKTIQDLQDPKKRAELVNKLLDN